MDVLCDGLDAIPWKFLAPGRLTFGVIFPVSAFRAIIASSLAFRAITFPFRRSKPSSYLRSVFRAITSQFRHSKPSSYVRSAFKAITSQYRCSESSSSHFQSWRFKAIITPQFDVQSRIPRLAFKAIISFGVQSHHFSVLAFKATSSLGVQICFFI
uniref:Uncharacterized protein n=1 Tax=Vitis vinifera TaxID=29760 RepID=A5AJZ4_VITVI|nr:hypothetical protein VITISV_024116 [Vitis vinifera]